MPPLGDPISPQLKKLLKRDNGISRAAWSDKVTRSLRKSNFTVLVLDFYILLATQLQLQLSYKIALSQEVQTKTKRKAEKCVLDGVKSCRGKGSVKWKDPHFSIKRIFSLAVEEMFRHFEEAGGPEKLDNGSAAADEFAQLWLRSIEKLVEDVEAVAIKGTRCKFESQNSCVRTRTRLGKVCLKKKIPPIDD